MIRCNAWIALALGSITAAVSQQASNSSIAIQVVDQTGAQFQTRRSKSVQPKAAFFFRLNRAELKLDSCPGPCEFACINVLGAPPVARPLSLPGLRIVVDDQSGVRISLARIDVRNEKNSLAVESIADKWGEATLALDPAKYIVSVEARALVRLPRLWISEIQLISRSESRSPLRTSVQAACRSDKKKWSSLTWFRKRPFRRSRLSHFPCLRTSCGSHTSLCGRPNF
jgi:hypothetical protein